MAAPIALNAFEALFSILGKARIKRHKDLSFTFPHPFRWERVRAWARTLDMGCEQRRAEEMSARETHDPGPGYVGRMTGRRYSLRDSGSWLSRPALSSWSSVSLASWSPSCISKGLPSQFLTNLAVSCLTHFPHSHSSRQSATNFHMVPPGWSGLWACVSWSVSCCKLLMNLPGSLATTVIMQPVVAPGLSTDVGGNTGSQH